jgi:hypothetical protein
MTRSLTSWVLENRKRSARISRAESEVEKKSQPCDYCGKLTHLRNLYKFAGGLMICYNCKKSIIESNMKRRNSR